MQRHGPARHVADKGLAAAVAEGKANGLWVREIDDLPATVRWGVQVRQSSLHIAQCIARVQESCAALL
jgi:hypothetical protein